MARETNTFTKTVLFRPSAARNLRAGGARIENITLGGDKEKDEGAADVINTGSFRYDPSGSPLKSTQQLNVDWSKWENHTFFNSAQAKVQTSLNQIINQYPFDGTKSEYVAFIDSLTGFTKYILSLFPKNIGSLQFSGSSAPTVEGWGSYLSVNDFQGTGTIAGSLGATGKNVLDFSYLPFTIETTIFIPSGSQNDNAVILQRLSGSTKGITMAITSSSDLASGSAKTKLYTFLSSGSEIISASVDLDKGVFQHIAAVYDRNDTGKLSLYVDGVREATSSQSAVFGDYGFQVETTKIGSGALHSFINGEFLPAQTLSGALDEFRWFHEKRSEDQIQSFANQTIFPDKDQKLRLYFRFNEPSGSFGIDGSGGSDSLVLDYSGNGLHTPVTNFNMSLRETGSLPPSLISEDAEQSPVLFPAFDGVVSLGTNLLLSASQYDYNNPNLITKMIPRHYLLEAAASEGMEEGVFGDVGESFSYTSDLPGRGRMRSPQIIAALLYTWAETFDELKMFVDEFGRLLNIDYRKDGTISDQLLPFLARYYGLNLPNAYANASLRQLIEKQDIKLNKVSALQGLQAVQNTLWRRVLSDLPEILKSKGTRHSLGVIFRNLGINPDGAFRIREYGGSRTKSISDSFEKRHEMAAMLDFTGSLSTAGTIDGSGRDSNRPLIQTGYLSASRIEPGVPLPKGTFNEAGISPDTGDGLFTSGSWSLEGVFKFDDRIKQSLTQSLMRLQTTGVQESGASNNWLIFNTVACAPITGANQEGSLAVFGRPLSGSAAKTFQLELTGVNLFDGNKWHVSIGRTRNDQASSYVSSSYFLRAGRMGITKVEEFYVTAAYYDDHGNNVLNRISGSNNASGSFVVVGSQSLSYDSTTIDGGIHTGFLNSVSAGRANYVDFTGKCSGIRFFSKALSQKETLMHVRNFKSLGVENPNINFNFNTTSSGSFERLRFNLSCDQPVTKSDGDKNIRIFDFSQNDLHASGTGFEAGKQVIYPERFDYMILSPRFELAVDPNKIRIRSFQQAENIRKSDMSITSYAPMYSIPENEEPRDDRRLSIEVSSVQALNEDITNIFATLDVLDNALGNPELVFSQEYPELRHLRKIYFNRLDRKVSLTKFFEFFKWFDQAVGDLLEEVIPSSTRYLGTNFVVEGHALERAKFTYNYSNMYVGVIDRREASVIFLQQFLGTIRKF